MDRSLLPQEIKAIFKDGLRFISHLKIVNKQGKLVRLIPTDEQVTMFQYLEHDIDVVFGKPRQIGSSTFIAAYLFWKWLSSGTPINVAILSKDWDSTTHIFSMWKTFYQNLPEPLQFPLEIDNHKQMKLRDSGAIVRAISSKKTGALRSYTQNYVHLSELAFTDNAEEVKSTAYAALNGNQLIIESTANYFNDVVHQSIMKSQRGEAKLNYTFFSWLDHKEYKTEIPTEGFQLTAEEIEYRVRLSNKGMSATLEQMAWRRTQIEKHGLAKFQREFPVDLEEAYAQQGNSYFTADDLINLVILKVDNAEHLTHLATEPGEVYAIGCDVASGRGGDYSTIVVLHKRSMSIAATYHSNTIGTEMFARIIQEYSTRYNNALVLVESNNWGLPVLNELRHLGFMKFWKDDKGNDWTTSSKTKLTMFEELRSAISQGIITEMDNIMLGEIRSYVLDSKGLAPHVPANLPHHGDLIIGLALAYQCQKKVRIDTAMLPNWIKKQKASRMKSKSPGMNRRY